MVTGQPRWANSGARGTGLGHLLVAEGLRKAAAEYPARGLGVSVQAHLEPFYARHGFTICGETFPDYGIAHVTMRIDAGQLTQQ